MISLYSFIAGYFSPEVIKKMKNAKKLRRKLDYLPSWAWYVLSLCIAGPVGPVVVYLLFYALDKAVKEENDS